MKVEPQKNIRHTHIFKENIQKCWETIANFDKCDELFKDLRTNIAYISGSDTISVDNIFEFDWMGIKLEFECKEVINTPQYKKIYWKVKSQVIEFSYDYIYYFATDSVEKKTLFVWDQVYHNPEKLVWTKDMLDTGLKMRKDCIKRWEYYLKKNPTEVEQIETITVNANIDKVWNVVSDLKIFYKITNPDIVVESTGRDIGEEVIIKLGTDNEFILKVVNISQKDDTWRYELDCKKVKKIPKQRISFILNTISDDFTYVIMIHKFFKQIKSELINHLKQEKIRLLNGLKNYFEL